MLIYFIKVDFLSPDITLMKKWISFETVHDLAIKTNTHGHCNIPVKSLSNNAFLIGPAEINRVLLKLIIRPWGFRRRMNCWHCTMRVVSTDTILSVIHQRVIDVPSRPENKRKRGAARRRAAGGIHSFHLRWKTRDTISRRLGGHLSPSLYSALVHDCVCVRKG